MNADNFFYFGAIIRPHGIEGAIVAALDVDHPGSYANLNTAYIELNDELVPFTIKEISVNDNTALIQFKNVNSAGDAELIIGNEIYLPIEKLPHLEGNQFYYHEIKGFQLIDKLFGAVGEIVQVFDMPQQGIAQVFYNNREVLIPLKDDFIDSIDRANKNLYMNLPDGLIQVYLS